MIRKKSTFPTQGDDRLIGTAGSDTIGGLAGNDTIDGGDGDDVINGGTGDDVLRGGKGSDEFVWAWGDGSDRIDAGADFDLADLTGTSATDKVRLSAKGDHLRVAAAGDTIDAVELDTVVLRLGDGADNIDIGDLEGSGVTQVLLDAGFALSTGFADLASDFIAVAGSAGKDAITIESLFGGVEVEGLAAQVRVAGTDANDNVLIAAGEGNDTVVAHTTGENGPTLVLDGGAGDDRLTGGRGDDRLFGGDGDDQLFWATGDGDDTFDGQDGTDTLRVVATGGAGAIQVSAAEDRIRIDLPDAVLEVNEVEALSLRATGGSRAVFIRDITGTKVAQINVDLGTRDEDRGSGVILEATGAADTVTITGANGSAKVAGLAAEVRVRHGDDAAIEVDGGDGDDVLRASGLRDVRAALGGGDGDDRLIGGFGDDDLAGGDGRDMVSGGRGDDDAVLGAGDDVYIFVAGEGSDQVNGGDGLDRIEITATGDADTTLLSAEAGLLRMVDDRSGVIEAFGVEHVSWFGGRGGDEVRVSDLSDTDVVDVFLDFAAKPGSAGGDGDADTLRLFGTEAGELIELREADEGITAFGLGAQVSAVHLDASDRVIVRGGGGDDMLLVSTPTPDPARFSLFGEEGNDILFGGDGDEALDGGTGDDEIGGGGGRDVMTGGTGADLFRFFAIADSVGKADVITDFHHVESDRIDLSAIDADLSASGDQAFRFIDAGGFSGAGGEVHTEYDTHGAIVTIDLDGDRLADFTLRLAGFDASHALVAADFIL